MRVRLLITAVLLWSCNTSMPPAITPKNDSIVYVHDTVPAVCPEVTKPVPAVITIKEMIQCNHKQQIDSLKTALLVQKYKVARVRYYLKIAIRNPSQDKFLKGWIKRAIE